MAGSRIVTGGKDALVKRNHKAAQGILRRFTATPPVAESYGVLKTGPDMAIQYEANVAAPVDGSNPLLRSLSPFIMQVEPPLAFAADGGFLDGDGKRGVVDVTGYRKALKNSSPYFESRRTLSQSNFATADYGAMTHEEVVSKSTGEQRVAKAGSPANETVSARGQKTSSIGIPSLTDLNTAVDIGTQLKGILETPPLVLLINPESLSISRTKIQQYSDRTRQGYVFHAWGQEQEKLSITAKCGAFLSAGRGVQYASKRDSAAWQNLMAAFQFYRSNGYIFDTVGQSYANHFVGALSIQYDGWIYFGNMESFSWSHDNTNELGGVVFSMEFVANSILDTSEQVFNVTPMYSPNGGSRSRKSGGNDFDPAVGKSVGGADDAVAFGAADLAQAGLQDLAPATVAPAVDLPVSTGGFAVSDLEIEEIPIVVSLPPEPFRVGGL